MVEFQFMSGLKTIGSNIIDIRSDNGRVIFDYGEISDPETGELPDYNRSDEPTAIFISHLHIDHIGSLADVPEDIPVYMSKESYNLYQLLIEIEEEVTIPARVNALDYDREMMIGDIAVTLKQSDHDIKGASAFFVQTPDVKLIHSGDVRLTGNNPEFVHKWVKEAKDFASDILLLEGTMFSFDEKKDIVSENELYIKWRDLLAANDSEIIFINTYIRDTMRLRMLADQVQSANRHFVFEPKYAYLLEAFEDYKEGYVLKELDIKEQFKDRWISLKAIQEEPDQYVLQNSYQNRALMENFDQGFYGHSNGEPLGDYDDRYETLMDTIASNQFKWIDLNAGGHAEREDLVWLAQMVNARMTIPWHSFKPEALGEALAHAGLNTMLPERDVVYSMKRLNQKKEGE